jgi:hypothetical protein
MAHAAKGREVGRSEKRGGLERGGEGREGEERGGKSRE